MKNIGLIIVAMCAFLSFPSYSDGKGKNSVKKQTQVSEVNRNIQQLIEYPKFARKHNTEGTVIIKYHISTDGIIHVDDVLGRNVDLNSYVKGQLEGRQIQFDATSEETLLKVKFRLLDE